MEFKEFNGCPNRLYLDGINQADLSIKETIRTDTKFLISKDRAELEDFKQNYYSTNKHLNKIVSGDKVFFSKNSSFPSLLLGRINDATPTGVKRVTKEDKADKIICDFNPLVFDGTDGIIIRVNDAEWYFVTIEKDYRYKDQLFTQVDNSTEFETYWAISVSGNKNEDINTYLNPGNRVDTISFVKYLNTFMPKLTGSELQSIKAMLKCSNNEDYKTALDTLQYYDFSEECLEIIDSIIESESFNNRLSAGEFGTSGKYIYFLLGRNPKELSKMLGYRWNNSIYCDNIQFTNYMNYISNIANFNNVKFPEAFKDRVIKDFEEYTREDYWQKRYQKEGHCQLTIEPGSGKCTNLCTYNYAYKDSRENALHEYTTYTKMLEYFNLDVVLRDA